jgi:outer membrane receptor protein involved in Fe transport
MITNLFTKKIHHTMKYIVIVSFLLTSVLSAGNTGKIAGLIRDKQTREPLVGANIIVKGTTLGTVTDLDGKYFILRVNPGTVSVQITMMGYRSVITQNVVIREDLTTEVNADLEQTSVQLGDVVVTAEQKLVQRDVTSTRKTISQEAMRAMPGLESSADFFKVQSGAFLSSASQYVKLGDGSQLQVRDESLKDIHVRGGRGGEILYMIDGMPVTHPIYGGRSVLDLNIVDVQSVELLTGGFSAEYGQAQSGVVNISTRSGGDQYKGGMEYKTDKLHGLGEVYNTDYSSVYIGGPEPLTQELLPLLGLQIPGKVSFFLSGNINITDTEYDNSRIRGKFPLFFGLEIDERQDNTLNLNTKLNWDFTSQDKFVFSYHGSYKQWSSYDWLWKYSPDRIATYSRNNDALNLQYNHVISNSSYFNLNFGYLGVGYRGSLNGKSPDKFWYKDTAGKYVTTITQPQIDPRNGFYDTKGSQNIWRDDNTKSFTFKADYTSQIHSAHLIKTGIEMQYHEIGYIDIQDGGVKLSRYALGIDSLPPPGPYPMFGQLRWVFNVKPMIGSTYLQDKFELEYLVINAGIRVDWLSLGSTVMAKDWKVRWEEATGLTPDWNEFRYKISPRLGISFPISERMVIFFSYGHFNQLPELQYYYRDPYSGGTTGNPRLDYEQTILYEFGLTSQISDYWAIDVKSYAKDISKQVGTTRLLAALGTPVDLFDNNGYARARGLEFELTKSYSDLISGKMTYTIQWTSGYSSSAFDDYIRSQTDFPNPIRERALSWDVRHQVILQTSLAAAENQQEEIFGIKLPDSWNMTLLYRFSTGTPYTPGDATVDPAEFQRRENTAIGPSTSSTDIKFEKGFNAGSGIKLAITVDVFNVFDQKNMQIYYGFNNWTGKPLKFGDVQNPQNNYFDYYTMLSLMDPRQFSTGRTIKLGFRIDF